MWDPREVQRRIEREITGQRSRIWASVDPQEDTARQGLSLEIKRRVNTGDKGLAFTYQGALDYKHRLA